MARSMGDATSSQAISLPPGLALVAGYDTGTPDIKWTTATWELFPNAGHVHIDQGGIGAPVYSANVIDVETGAWSPSQVTNWMNHSTAARPAVYVNRTNLIPVLSQALQSPRFKGDVWLAFPAWDGTLSSLPALPAGCRYVAIQDDFRQLYDLSTVLDPTWPLEDPMEITIPGVPGFWLSVQILSSADGSKQVAIGLGTDGALWQVVRSAGVWGAPVPV